MDQAVDGIVTRSMNFGYLARHEPLLAYDGATAESYIYTEPDMAVGRARRFVETLVAKSLPLFGITKGKDLNANIKALETAGALGQNMVKACHEVRRAGNQAIHEHQNDIRAALLAVQDCFHLGLWLYNAITGAREERVFIPPQPPRAEMFAASTELAGAAKEIRLLLATYRERLIQQVHRASPANTRQTAEHKATSLMESLAACSEQIRDLDDRTDAAQKQRQQEFESRLEAHDPLPDETCAQHRDYAEEAVTLAEAEYERLVTLARQLLTANGFGVAERSAAINIAGANSNNIVIGSFSGSTFNQARPGSPAGEQP